MSAAKVRGGIRSQVNQLHKALAPQLTGTAAPVLNDLSRAHTKVTGYLERVYTLDRQVLDDHLENQDETAADRDVEQSQQFNDQVLDFLLDLQSKIDELQTPVPGLQPAAVAGNAAARTQPSSSSNRTRLRLPKLDLCHFAGDYLEWQSFWDMFNAAVHQNTDLTDVEKFTYLKGVLRGDAKAVIEGFELQGQFYHEAVAALVERFGDEQRAQFGHVKSFLAVMPATDSLVDLRTTFDKCERHIRSLTALGLAEDTFSVVFAPMLLSKLPEKLTKDLHTKNGDTKWQLSNIRKWVKEELKARELTEALRHTPEIASDRKHFTKSNTKSYEQKEGSSVAMLPAPGARKVFQATNPAFPRPFQATNPAFQRPSKCIFCNDEDHYSDQCHRFPTIEARKAQVIKLSRCLRCTGKNHNARTCFRIYPCFYCRKTDHHRSLCFQRFGKPSQAGGGRFQAGHSSKSNDPRNQLNVEAQEFYPNDQGTGLVVDVKDEDQADQPNFSFLPTAWVTFVNDVAEAECAGRVILDTCGSRCYITEDMARRLGLKVIEQVNVSTGSFGTKRRMSSVTKKVRVGLRCLDGTILSVVAHVKPVITADIVRIPVDRKRFPVVERIQLAEPSTGCPDELPLDMLIGNDYYYQVVTRDRIDCEGGLVLIGSKFGYLTAGTQPIAEQEETENALVLAITEVSPGHTDPYSTFDLERFWKLEEAGVRGKQARDDISDEDALANFYSTLKFEKGRYWVTWPWKMANPELADNSKLAFTRTRGTYARLRKNFELLSAYDDIIRDQLSRDIIEEAPEIPTGPVYYLPHHEILTPTKVTTKIRIVYDASSKSGKDALSLNDCMHRGVVVLEDLCGLLMRFRTWRIGIVADIEKAFLQIGLQETERDVARFYWVRDVNKPFTSDNLVVYRFTKVFFGAIGSPSLLGSTLDAHSRRVESSADCDIVRYIARSFRENIYSDNHIGGEDDEELAVLHYQESKKLCKGASMNLREFYTNSKILRDRMASEDVGKSLRTKVLGVSWDLQKDTVHCGPLKGEFSNVGPFTKRVITRDVAKIFDPCGWMSPVVLPAKLLIQDLWKQQLEWDASLPPEMVAIWVRIRESLAQIPTIEIPRYVGNTRHSYQLHAFCDASLKASATAVYLRTMSDGPVVCNLLMSKTRLAPITPQQTIPRLELISVELGVRLVEFAAEHLKGLQIEKFVWSDSQCVLSWIKNEKLTTRFVKTRVESIRAAKGVEFRFVSGLENPADLPSRGSTSDKVKGNEVWWHGPPWLRESKTAWPPNVLNYEQAQIPKTEIIPDVVAVVAEAVDPVIDFSTFQTLPQAVRVVAWMRRVLNGLVPRIQRRMGPLSLVEITRARQSCEKLVQAEGFDDFERWQRYPKTMPDSLRPLSVYRDQDQLLRCKSRLQNADLPFDAQNPILLPKHHPYTRLVISHAHQLKGHAGVAQTLASVRQAYWIVHGKSTVKSVIQQCYRCRRTEGGPYKAPDLPPLPEFRVDASVPFEFVGLDNLGPLLIKTSEKQHSKIWITLFTCAVTRAVHLEVVADQSAQEFHLALRRFIATYGSPRLIVSDNASQYRLVHEVLQKLTPSEISQEVARKFQVEWKYIPEVGPWFGGFYERMIGLVKRFLRKALHGILATMTELQTVVAEITYIVNSRPLLSVDSDHSFCGLSPNDFLGKPRQSCFPTFDEAPNDLRPYQAKGRLLERWKQLQRLSEQFWQLFRQAYLTSLREKYSKTLPRGTSSLTPTVGSVVQVKEEKQPRGKWRVAVIESLIPSNDGKVRSVILRLPHQKHLIRPVKMLYPLEMTVHERGAHTDHDFTGFSQGEVDRAQAILKTMPGTPGPAGGSASEA